MNTTTISILPFEPGHQVDIDVMMGEIASEFEEPIFSRNGTGVSIPIRERRLWVAVANGIVIGTGGVVITNSGFAVLKSLFVAKEQRATPDNLGSRLLETAIAYAIECGICEMYLGTMSQFKAAQRFYVKHGFTQIQEAELPIGFPGSELDTVFYRKDIC